MIYICYTAAALCYQKSEPLVHKILCSAQKLQTLYHFRALLPSISHTWISKSYAHLKNSKLLMLCLLQKLQTLNHSRALLPPISHTWIWSDESTWLEWRTEWTLSSSFPIRPRAIKLKWYCIFFLWENFQSSQRLLLELFFSSFKKWNTFTLISNFSKWGLSN